MRILECEQLTVYESLENLLTCFNEGPHKGEGIIELIQNLITFGGIDLKDWTIMVYMAGDNNLSENMAFSLEDLRKFSETLKNSKGNKMNLLAYFDSNSLTAPTYHIDYSDGKIKKYALGEEESGGKKGKMKIAAGGESNSSSAESIVNFVRWCIKDQKRTAANYAIIFSGHSFGFHGTSFLRDETSGGSITISDFRSALE